MDAPEQARRLSELYDGVLGGGRSPGVPRPLVAESWQRSLAALVDPELDAPPVVVSGDELDALRADHPLHAVLPVLRQTLTTIADEASHIMIVTDARGLILWREGAADVRRQADRIALSEGAIWSEDAIGTNGMGTALAADQPVQIHSAEHLVRRIHAWTCAAAPVHDPDTGKLIGAVDVSGPLRTVHPAMMALVTAAAKLAEGQLRVRMAAADEVLRARNMRHLIALGDAPGALLTPTGRVLAVQPLAWLPDRLDVPAGADRIDLGDGREAVVEPLDEGYLLRIPGTARRRRTSLRLQLLGSRPPVAVVGGREISLTLRRAEVLALLLLHPAGLTGEQLMLQLYGDEGNPATVRAEMHRLRNLLGGGVLDTKPYRILAEVSGDVTDVQAAVRRGDLPRALDLYAGPLLVRSDAPALRAVRDELDATLRRAVLDSGDPELLWRYADTSVGAEDLEIFEMLARALPADDHRRAAVAARIHRLAEQFT
ncbi:putative phytochrome sensor protein [Kribbella flavida DSM 17836]|uniref:Putative phytochrome sensor protein n=1 Tax=Kribbella flavida (strain DSM 17836 / JCM 10339 / NBRC 14399) TaxID=479435 RepID=D2Q2A1_KRIFD|nr:helix-turn-helix domain-containing protein [Kribbella flavida]ADB35797.1 putative phytochrome sensor protein [Kribbella flavida DSM 17836]